MKPSEEYDYERTRTDVPDNEIERTLATYRDSPLWQIIAARSNRPIGDYRCVLCVAVGHDGEGHFTAGMIEGQLSPVVAEAVEELHARVCEVLSRVAAGGETPDERKAN
jgi:hypothetical protein